MKLHFLYKKVTWIKWILFSFFILSLTTLFAQAPNISRVEWYLDNDPGFGNATNLSFTGTNNVTAQININTTSLTTGVHVVGVRSKDVNGAWSMDNEWLFLKPYSGAALQPNITRVEWYLDNYPSYGSGTPITITAAQNLAGLAVNIPLTALTPGIHVFGVRSKDANGAWSLDNAWLFLKPYNGAVIQPDISRVEWYLDNDPGYGNGTPINITPAQNLSGLAINIGLTPLSPGIHIVGIRSQDANGAWSIDNNWIFLKPYASAPAQPKIISMEYYIDTDPGYGHASAITITSATDINTLIFNADISTVPNGAHKLGIRSEDANGAWSIDNELDFTGGTGTSATIWTGTISSSWINTGNWSTGKVPIATDSVVVPSGTTFPPIIVSGVTGTCKSILVKSGATVSISLGGELEVGP